MQGRGKRLSKKMYLEGQKKILQPFTNFHVLQTGESLSVSAFHITTGFSKQSSRVHHNSCVSLA